MTKAVALLSGGLDSSLAIKLMQMQGIDVIGLHFVSVFLKDGKDVATNGSAALAARELGIEMHLRNSSETILALLQNPPHGFGKNLNPCIDCRIAMLCRAVEFMREIDAQFVITGEVVGQRPMSQRRHAMDMIDSRASVGGLVVRPLCGKILPPTNAERDGLIKREKMLGISGRGRKEQLALAQEFGLTEFPNPAGGCLLTENTFVVKIQDVLDHPPFVVADMDLLKSGRHFRLDAHTKAVVGRHEQDNECLISCMVSGDVILCAIDLAGPITILRGETSEANLTTAARITARYSQGRGDETVKVGLYATGDIEAEPIKIFTVRPAGSEEFRGILIK